MTPIKVLVTGATGFIGTRLCERLKLEYRLPFRALVRNFTNANRIARMDAEMVYGNLMDLKSVRRALEGCDCVMHLAHADVRSAALETRNLIAACVEAKIKRFVHVSSMAVHGPNPGPECAREETATIGHYGEPYSDSKAEVEKMIHRAVRSKGLPAVVLRPTIVYGPYSPFVMAVVMSTRQEKLSLLDEGAGLCNAVFVDDVCDAIHAAAVADDGVGKAFFVTGDRAITWKEFNLTFARMVHPSPRVVNFRSEDVRRHWAAQEPTFLSNFSTFKTMLLSSDFHDQLMKVPVFRSAIVAGKRLLVKHLPPEKVVVMRNRYQQSSQPVASLGPEWPNKGRIVREAFKLEFSNQNAKRVLNWTPAYDFARGAETTQTWLRFARFIPSDLDWVPYRDVPQALLTAAPSLSR